MSGRVRVLGCVCCLVVVLFVGCGSEPGQESASPALRLTVLDEQGDPLPGARAVLVADTAPRSIGIVEPDQFGVVRFEGLSRDRTYALRVECPGYATRALGEVALTGRVTDLGTIALRPERVEEVTVEAEVYPAREGTPPSSAQSKSSALDREDQQGRRDR
jgi:hypothetical protein